MMHFGELLFTKHVLKKLKKLNLVQLNVTRTNAITENNNQYH